MASPPSGPALQYLPAALWLLGLGHLGQAYAWTLGMLPYATPGDVELGLVDFDTVVEGNTATQLLVTADDVDKRKTRIVAAALEKLGLRHPDRRARVRQALPPGRARQPNRNEPTIALAGFDDVDAATAARRCRIRPHRRRRLGAGPVEYLDMVIHTFPAAGDPGQRVPGRPAAAAPARRSRTKRDRRQVEAGRQTAARCGMLDIAGVTVGAAFVGTVASTLVVADILRLLHDGQSYSVITLDLRNPGGIHAVRNSAAGDYPNLAFTVAR